jgi:hypothetical protein
MKEMKEKIQTSRDFCRHATTGEIYAIEMTWVGEVVGSAGRAS